MILHSLAQKCSPKTKSQIRPWLGALRGWLGEQMWLASLPHECHLWSYVTVSCFACPLRMPRPPLASAGRFLRAGTRALQTAGGQGMQDSQGTSAVLALLCALVFLNSRSIKFWRWHVAGFIQCHPAPDSRFPWAGGSHPYTKNGFQMFMFFVVLVM